MSQTKLTEIVYIFCLYFLKLVYVNILWFLFSLLGLGIFGIAPATIALCKIQHEWLTEKKPRTILSSFWKEYKAHFVKGNGLALILFAIGFLLYFDLQFFMQKSGVGFQVISVGIFILSIWYMIVLIYIFPTYTAFRLRLTKYISYAFIIGMLNPFKTIGLAIAASGMVYLSLYYPGILLSLGVSLTFFIVMIVGGQAIQHVSLLKERRLQR